MRPSRLNWPVPGTRRTRTTASLRRPTVWIGRSMNTGWRGRGLDRDLFDRLGCHVDVAACLDVVVCHCATCLISNGIGC